jgi:plastocyanin
MTRFHARCATLAVLALTTACSDDPVSQNGRASAVSTPAGASLSSNRGNGNGNGPKRFIAVLDDCDPNDPAWAPTGGCLLKDGDVTNAEFGAFLNSPLSLSVVGHPAWRNEPSYVKIEVGESVRVTNEGGRLHTFTPVANFGGGRVPPLSVGLTVAPECAGTAAASTEIPPGATLRVEGLTVGTTRYQCCIHPWMRAAIKVLPDRSGHSKS